MYAHKNKRCLWQIILAAMLPYKKITTAEEASIIDSTTTVLPGNMSTSSGRTPVDFIDNGYNN